MTIDRGITVPARALGRSGGGDEVHVTEVDGVPTVWADVPGPLHAGLLLRMGAADETLVTRGVSHMLEHLALFGVGRPGDHSNGHVDVTTTLFHTTGDPTAVAEFLDRVTAQLVDPPVSRLEDEKGVLWAEAAGRSGTSLSLWRYGARGHGLPGFEEHGLRTLDADALRAWSRRFAVRSNAVLFLSGPPPEGLRLALGEGPPVPAPDPTRTVLPRLPAFASGHPESAVVQSVVERGWASVVLQGVLRARLVDELRVRRAAAYSPGVDYRPVDGRSGVLTLFTDLVPGRQRDAVRYLLDVTAHVADGDGGEALREEEVAEQVRLLADRHAEPGALMASVNGAAWDLLFGRPVDQPAQSRQERATVTVQDVAARARAAAAGAFAIVPADAAPHREPWTPAPACVAQALPDGGTTYRPVDVDDRARLVLSPSGVSIDDGGTATVRLDATEAVLSWPDGRRVLIGSDATSLSVEPTLWRRGRDLVAEIDRLWPAPLVVPMPAREAGTAPRPRTRAAVLQARLDAYVARWSGLPGFALFAGKGLLAVAALVVLALAGVGLLGGLVVLAWRTHLMTPLLVGIGVGVVSARRERRRRRESPAP